MGLADIVNLQISASSAAPTQEGFGTPMVVGYHTRWGTVNGERSRSYTSLAGLVADGFVATDAIYRAVQTILSQNPRVERVKVGRRALAFTQVVELTPAAPAAGKVYTVTVGGLVATFTVTAESLAATCTAIAAAITALAVGVTASGASGTKVVCTTTAMGVVKSYEAMSSTLTLFDASTDPGIATDLAAINGADSDWYGLVLDNNSKAEGLAAAAWAEANGKLFVAQSADSACKDSLSTTDVIASMKTSAYARSGAVFHPSIGTLTSWLAAGLLADRLPDTPGSDTWAYKTVSGVDAYALTDTERTNLLAKNATIYTVISGIACTEGGKVAAGEWFDVVRGLDWMKARIRERIFGVLIAAKKVPFTDPGISLLAGEVRAQLRTAITVGLLTDDPAPVVTQPKASAISAVNRQARKLTPGIEFNARLAGAIHTLDVTGTVTN